MKNEIFIVPFAPSLAANFAQLNRAWIERYFVMEQLDEEILSHPQTYIIDKGGAIFFANYKGSIAGTFALQKNSDGSLELAKMAVDESFQGLKIGHALIETAINKARESGAGKVILYSNTKLQSAIHLYKKFGFKEVPLEHSEYNRSNIKMMKEII